MKLRVDVCIKRICVETWEIPVTDDDVDDVINKLRADNEYLWDIPDADIVDTFDIDDEMHEIESIQII